MKLFKILPIAMGLLLPIAGYANPLVNADIGINAEVRQALSEARKEVRADLAKARQDLDTENLQVSDGMHIGNMGKRRNQRSNAEIPRAEITRQGDFLIEGKAQQVDVSQRRQLLAYRLLVIEIAKAGIDIGENTTDAVLKEVDGHWVGLLFSAMTGGLERRVERTVKQEVEPAMRGICRLLPKVMSSQQRLASRLPQFRPYATLEQKDIDGCEDEVRSGFASL